MRSRSPDDARPVRTVLNSTRACSTDFCIRVCASLVRSSTVVAIARPLLRSLDDRTDVLAGDDATDVAIGKLEDVNAELVVHAERQRGRVHHLEPALDRLQMCELWQELRSRIEPRAVSYTHLRAHETDSYLV